MQLTAQDLEVSLQPEFLNPEFFATKHLYVGKMSGVVILTCPRVVDARFPTPDDRFNPKHSGIVFLRCFVEHLESKKHLLDISQSSD
jgi:hypothetical protein